MALLDIPPDRRAEGGDTVAEHELSARQVRNLPDFAKVTVHGSDPQGRPTRRLCFVHTLPNGRKVLQPVGKFCEGFVDIRRGKKYTMAEETPQCNNDYCDL